MCKKKNIYNSVFQAELAAISDAVTWLINYIPYDNNRNVFIYSDSLSAIMALQNPVERSAAVRECKGPLNRLHANNRTVVCWIKGHAEHTGNEMADVLVKAGTTSACYVDLPAPRKVAKAVINEQIIKWWQWAWDNVEGHRQTKVFIRKVDTAIH